MYNTVNQIGKKMSREHWNEKFRIEEYVFGKTPNEYFKRIIDKLKPGRILLPAEGEGRNAVYAAVKGWEVDAFDVSDVGKAKALKLAKENGVEINFKLMGFGEFDCDDEIYDCIGLINAHAIENNRRGNHRKLIDKMKRGGSLILQGFTKEQAYNNSGGPKNVEMLFSREELEEDFKDMSKLNIEELLTELNDGIFHVGQANIIRIEGVK